jgi:hypothetical protein
LNAQRKYNRQSGGGNNAENTERRWAVGKMRRCVKDGKMESGRQWNSEGERLKQRA